MLAAIDPRMETMSAFVIIDKARHGLLGTRRGTEGNTPAITPSAPKPATPSARAATTASAATKSIPMPIAPHVAVMPGLAATHFAPSTVTCRRVSVVNSLDILAATARAPGIFTIDTVALVIVSPTSAALRAVDKREGGSIATALLARRKGTVRVWKNFILKFRLRCDILCVVESGLKMMLF
jgi:hypothetical protein